MSWRSMNSNDNNDVAMSSSMDDDEPDSGSQDPVHADGGVDDLHGRLGTSGPDLPPTENRLLEKENMTMGEEKKQTELENGLSSTPPPPSAAEDSSSCKTQSLPTAQSQASSPVTTQSTCEFTHKIVNYSQKRESGCKKAEYSATTVDEFGNRWRLIVYVNGNGRASNHHLSLFLQVADADDLPFGWKKAVSYVLTLEHPSGVNLSYAKRNPDKTFKLCPKAIDWGWSQFITSDRIQQEGFVHNDSLTVRASVTVKSSSVSIDAEDAELYLKCAVEEGGAEAVKLCLAQGASVSCKFKDDLYTPLHTACSSGNNGRSMEVLNLLLEKGADGNACNKWRETPLLIAANNGHQAAVEALLKHGADPSLCSEAGWSALTFAAHKGYDDIVSLLLRAGAPVNCRVTEDSSTPLHKACAGSKPGHLSAVKQLIDGGADVHALNKWRETPLLTAANHGQAGAVEALLKAGADPCKCTDTGWSPLSIAAYKGHDSVVRLLLEEGAPTEEADPTLSALLQAATKGLPDTVELLLRHGADHTVTTKKGDTALSILVEQNLIDAAVEMVTEYKASVPRCSRDRKKVQRARLLINLRMKQHQREGKLAVGSDDDETDEDSDDFKSAQHDENGSPTAATPRNKKKKKKKGATPKASAEEQARAAEEALLLELEEEDAKAKKEEAEANSKRAKKKKKKERERQQKLKEEEERREREEKEKQERERIRMEKEELERKERQQKLKEQKEREQKEAAEREKLAAAKRKEREQKEKKQREAEQKQREKVERQKKSAPPPAASAAAPTAVKGWKTKPNPAVVKKPVPVASTPVADPKVVAAPPVAAARVAKPTSNRGWETKGQPVKAPQPPKPAVQPPQPNPVAATKQNATTSKAVTRGSPKEPSAPPAAPVPSSALPPRATPPADVVSKQKTATDATLPVDASNANNGVRGPSNSAPRQEQAPPPDVIRDAFSEVDTRVQKNLNVTSVEHPAVAVFRREKVTELLQRCRMALNVVDESALRRVLYRWIVRAAHGQSSYIDCIIPSWVDFNQLATFFQRQFIAEGRKGVRGSSGGNDIVSMEVLREAGTSVANLCQSQAKAVVQFRIRMDNQVPRDWTDGTLMMSATDARNGNEIGVVVDWANRSKVYLTAKEYTTLRTRYVGPPNRFLASLFLAKTRYETKELLLADTALNFCLPPSTKLSLVNEASVAAELFSDPLTALESNVFWGNFEDVDSLFGGVMPFGKDEGSSEELLLRHGGSVSVLLPFDNMVASRYMHRLIDILEDCEPRGVPVSFLVFVRVDCFHDHVASPSAKDLHLFDPRLGDDSKNFLQRVETLSPGHHHFFAGGVAQVSVIGTVLALLQNDPAKACFVVTEGSMNKIKQSMSENVGSTSGLQLVNPMGFNGMQESPTTAAQPSYFEGLPPISPTPQHHSTFMDFGAAPNNNNISKVFTPAEARRAPPPRRGRLFELIDDGEEEQFNDVDVVSGMLNTLNVDLFQNSVSQDVDIEAISLMGIGSPPPNGLPPGNSHQASRFG
ncbi:ankyrin 3, node of Ranvier (ankyrin G) [Seminavis robusta]|uniref:Ankyrin 3, node of Ranvier (Ankyrin G) n=1 Tax=Seminavis robusta TaxID=568900 RepID=A0A9N8ET64_9STRA|nr:ankyrin 3, node of Ranvier (ankyrin G) [Seminavis robusta]|eukprot:Sro1892_g303860.1 ankyrin 3, node of Ranvier (ankyrin G) (1517) ;mRNA; r:12027-16947